ncbi:MAG: hypothetical protein K2Y17_10380 [Qipengyuania sp.]|nr:hypothetical protein [Qipengyuania sp.]
MAYGDDSPSWAKRIGGILLVVLVGSVVSALVRGGTDEALRYSQTTPAAVERAFEEGIEKDPNIGVTFIALKRYYPDKYQEFVEQASRELRAGADSGEMRAFSFQFMRQFMTEESRFIARAPVAELMALQEAQLGAARALQTENPSACAHYVVDGLQQSDVPSPSAAAAVARVAAQSMRAAASGRKDGVAVVEPSDSDWESLGAAMRDDGVSEEQLQHLADNTMSQLPDSDQCEMGISMLRAILSLSEVPATRISRAIFSSR